jgi:hypothetical protein
MKKVWSLFVKFLVLGIKVICRGELSPSVIIPVKALVLLQSIENSQTNCQHFSDFIAFREPVQLLYIYQSEVYIIVYIK